MSLREKYEELDRQKLQERILRLIEARIPVVAPALDTDRLADTLVPRIAAALNGHAAPPTRAAAVNRHEGQERLAMAQAIQTLATIAAGPERNRHPEISETLARILESLFQRAIQAPAATPPPAAPEPEEPQTDLEAVQEFDAAMAAHMAEALSQHAAAARAPVAVEPPAPPPQVKEEPQSVTEIHPKPKVQRRRRAAAPKEDVKGVLENINGCLGRIENLLNSPRAPEPLVIVDETPAPAPTPAPAAQNLQQVVDASLDTKLRAVVHELAVQLRPSRLPADVLAPTPVAAVPQRRIPIDDIQGMIDHVLGR